LADVVDIALADAGGTQPDPELLYLGGRAAIQISRPRDAVQLLQAAVALAPAHNSAWYDLGEAQYASRQFAAADRSWRNVAGFDALNRVSVQRRKVARILSGQESLNWAAIRSALVRPGIHFWRPNVEAAVPDAAVRLPMLVWLGESRRSEVCVTIDDGPSPDITPLILQILREKQIHAAFFLVGSSAVAHPDQVRRIADEGHEIYSHSYSHTKFTDLDDDAIIAELTKTEDELSKVRPTPSPYPIRLPGGMGWDDSRIHGAIRRWRDDAILVHWSVDPRDWAAQASIEANGDPIAEAQVRLCETALDPALGGAIILAHDCQMGLPRTHAGFIRHFYEGLADVIDDANLTPSHLVPATSMERSVSKPSTEQLSAPLAREQTLPRKRPQLSVEIVRVESSNWSNFSTTYDINGAPVPQWRHTISQPWVDTSRPIAYALSVGRKLVGWLQTIYADTRFSDGAPPTLVCSLSGWYVEEEHRASSLKLILAAMNDAGSVPMTVFTASHTAAKIYKGLRWHLLDNERWTFPLTGRTNGPALVEDADIIFDLLAPADQRILNDHRANGLNHAMIIRGERYCYFSYLTHKRLESLVADIVFLTGDISLLLDDWHVSVTTVLAKCQSLFVDCRYLNGLEHSLHRTDMWGARMFRGPDELKDKLSMLYSEVPLYRPFLL
jgi:peptidoglycan/xylan/chitin deacetylase (PgdA/CDA1 family)